MRRLQITHDRTIQGEVEEQFAWAWWDGNPAVTPQWIDSHWCTRRRLIAVRWSGRIAAVVERKALNLYGPVGRHHGGFSLQPGIEESDFVAGVTSLRWPECLLLPHSSTALRAAFDDSILAVTREHERIFHVVSQDPSAYAQILPRKLRATLRKADRVSRERGLEICHVPHGRLRERIAEMVQIERQGHRRKGRPLATGSVATALVKLDLAGRLVVHALMESGRTRAYLVAGRGARQDYFYTMAMHADLADASAGSMLFHSAIQASLSEGRSVCLGPGDTLFKRRFATSWQPQADIVVLSGGAGALAGPTAFVLNRLTGSQWS